MSAIVKEFPAVSGDDFGAQHAAEAWLQARGFSFGSSQCDGPQAVFFGEFHVSKWRNLSPAEKCAAHGLMDGARSSWVRITLRESAPPEAVAALNRPDEVQP